MIEKYLNNRLATLYFFPFIIGSLSTLSFQPFNLTIVNFIILPFFFYLLVFINKKSKATYRKKPYKKNLFIFGTTFGFGFFLSGIHWITHSLTFDDSFKILIPFGLIFIPLFLSLFFSLLTLIIGPFLSLNFASIFVFTAGLAFSDFLRAKILSGFPWNLWAYSFSWSTELIQIVDKLGLFGFNLILLTIFTLPVVIFFKINFLKKIFILVIIPFSLFILYIYGNYTINNNQKNLDLISERYKIKVISPNFKLEYGLSNDQIKKRLNKLIKYSETNNNSKTIYVWPEGVFSGYNFNEILQFKKIFIDNFNNNHLILFGINRSSEKEKGVFNSLLIINNQMEILQEYRKQKLVPFGEFLPFEKILKKFGLKKITEGHGSFLKGKSQKNLSVDKLNILPLICYEIIFPELVQGSDKGTNLIINISEDGWFGNSIGPFQHFAKASYRAIEQNSFLIRSANKGISAIINNKGQVIKKLSSNETGNIELEVPLIVNENKIKNDLIFFVLLITYIFIFNFYKKNND